MSRWFGGGSSSSSTSSTSDGYGDSGSSGSSFGTDYSGSSGPSSSFSSGGMSQYGGAGDSQAALREALQQEQQRAVIQAAIAKLTELCFDTCIDRPSAKLSSSEHTCISQCAERYLDTSMFVMGRLSKQQGGPQ